MVSHDSWDSNCEPPACKLQWSVIAGVCVAQEGDRIAMMRKSNGNLHYFINGLDQGVAATKVPACVWGVVDLYGMTVKVQSLSLYSIQNLLISVQ